MSTEADTRRKWVVPALPAPGGDNELHSIPEQPRIVAELDALLPAIPDQAFKGTL